MAPDRVAGALPPVFSTDEEESTQEESVASADVGEPEESEVFSHEANAPLAPSPEPLANRSTPNKRGSASLTSSSGTSSDSDFSSDSDSVSSQERVRRHSVAPNPTVNPLASKPLIIKPKVAEKTPMEKKPRSKAAVAASPVKPATATKRPVQETADRKESKRPKKKVWDMAWDGAAENLVKKSKDPKKSNHTVWSYDDAVLILNYSDKLYDFIMKHLHVAVSKSQVVESLGGAKKAELEKRLKEVLVADENAIFEAQALHLDFLFERTGVILQATRPGHV